jgi:hypothetical protein
MTDRTNHHDDDDPSLDPWTLESLLAGEEPSDDAAAPLAALIASARRPGDAAELRGPADMLAAFREMASVDEPVDSPNRRKTMLSTMTRSKLVVAATAGALTLGAASAAAYSNVLPDSMQAAAHKLINAPAPHGVGPDATGPAAKGLCTAYAANQQSGATPNSNAVAFRNLATAAGGQENITAYCATVMTPTTSPTETSSPTATATGSPTESATEQPTTEPTTAPTTSPTSAASTAKGQGTTNPGQGASQWTAHGHTNPFPGQGASHWPKSTSKPGKGHQPSPTTSTTSPTTAPTATATSS